MCTFLEILNRIINCSVELKVSDVSKMNASACCFNHFAKIVFAVCTIRACTESKTVMWIWNFIQHAHNIFLIDNNTWKSEYRPGWIIGMNCHINIVFVTNRHNCFKEVFKILEKLFVINSFVHLEKLFYAGHAFRFPSWKNKSI